MTNVGYATLSVIPSLKGFQSAVDRGTGPAMLNAGSRAGRGFSGAFTRSLKFGTGVGGIGAVFGVASFIKSSVELEAKYGKTMAQMRVATRAPADELKRLDDLAIKLGKETIFSAVDASDAMLELAKNGIKPATIEAGALESALTLAAAGGTDLESSAKVMGNTLNAFQLKGKKAASVAAALAGAANASSASVASLAEGLQQSSASAHDAGFNVQETTGILAAFANAGIEGSDAGTSLKTMLTRLVPSTAKAAGAMEKYRLKFTKTNGEFKSAVDIAENLKNGLGDLSAEERSAALNTIFGSDARRAATILTREGADGLAKYIKATSDQGAAEEMAQAKMEGTAGAIERLKGSWETTKLEFGKSIAPVAADFLDFLAGKVDDLAPKLVEFGGWFQDEGVPKLKQFKNFIVEDVVPALETIGDFASDAAGLVGDIGEKFNSLPGWVKKALVGGTLATVAANKVLPGGVPSLASAAISKAIPVRVFETNPLALGGGGVGLGAGGLAAGGAAGWGAKAAAAFKFGLTKGSIVLGGLTVAKLIYNAADLQDTVPQVWADKTGKAIHDAVVENFGNKNTTQTQTNGDPNPFASIYKGDPKDVSKKIDAALDASRAKAAGFGRELDLVGARKIDPTIKRESIDRANAALASFIGKQIDAGRPVTPYINTTSIERAIALLRTMNAEIRNDALIERGTDGGVTFQHGGTGITPRTGGVNFNGPINVTAHDYDDFTLQLERKARTAQRGGRG